MSHDQIAWVGWEGYEIRRHYVSRLDRTSFQGRIYAARIMSPWRARPPTIDVIPSSSACGWAQPAATADVTLGAVASDRNTPPQVDDKGAI